jgi:hypothetical protein
MDQNHNKACSWSERVSALIDDELPKDQSELVLAHIRSCSGCASLVEQLGEFEGAIPRTASVARDVSLGMNFGAPSFGVRIIAGFVGAIIVLVSTPRFIQGSRGGDVLHDLRHLSIWQLAIGFAVLTTAFTRRVSRLLVVLVISFLLLTGIAAVYDLLTGHNGPWTDPMHLVEVVAVLAVLRMISPFLFMSHRKQRKVLSRLQG